MEAEELEFCQGHVEWEEHVGLSRRRCPGGNEIYKSQSSEVGSGESLAKMGEIWAQNQGRRESLSLQVEEEAIANFIYSSLYTHTHTPNIHSKT